MGTENAIFFSQECRGKKHLSCLNLFNFVSDMSSFQDDQPKVTRVKSGHAAIFRLPTISSVPLPSVTWQREDNRLLYGAKYALTDELSQIILNVNSSDQARYR